MTKRIITATVFVFAVLLIIASFIYGLDYRFQNPELTETQLFIKTWPLIFPLSIGYFVISRTLKVKFK